MSALPLLDACAGALALATEVRSSALSLSVGELRSRFANALDEMVAAARSAGAEDADVAEARYALVAFIDEQVLRSSWSGRTEWMNKPLQLEMYRESTAGENFFVRLRSHLSSTRTSAAVEVYYVCLLLGFAGVYAGTDDGENLEKFKRAARSRLARQWPDARRISPRAIRSGRLSSSPTGWAAIFAMVLASALACGVIVLVLGWATEARLRDVVSGLASAAEEVNR